jgi:hypothetical protein
MQANLQEKFRNTRMTAYLSPLYLNNGTGSSVCLSHEIKINKNAKTIAEFLFNMEKAVKSEIHIPKSEIERIIFSIFYT